MQQNTSNSTVSYKELVRQSLSSILSNAEIQKHSTQTSLVEIGIDNLKYQNCNQLEFEEQYVLLQKIGEGAHGQVRVARNVQNDKLYAVKIIRTDDVELINQIKRTYQITKTLKNHNLVKTKELFISRGNCYEIMEYCEYPRLDPYNTDDGFVIRELLHTVKYLHKQGICHRDIKPDNILYQDGHLKLIDFGVCNKFILKNQSHSMWTNTGTIFYKAPEMFTQGQYDCLVDVWAVGVIMYQLLTKSLPFSAETVGSTIDIICNQPLKVPEEIDPVASDLLGRLLQKDPKKRLSAKQALKHPWFKSETFHSRDDVELREGVNNYSPLYIASTPSDPPTEQDQELFKSLIWLNPIQVDEHRVQGNAQSIYYSRGKSKSIELIL